jgi:hypothetical protein
MNGDSLNYDYQTQRLALGVKFVDELSHSEIIKPVAAEIEYQSPHKSPPSRRSYSFRVQGRKAPYGLLRSTAGHYSLVYYPGIQDQLDLRVFDYDRHYIPRRLRVPLLTLEQVQTIEENEDADYLAGRERNVSMFPGAAYHGQSRQTGIRGRVLRDGEPMRWAYVEAIDLISDEVIARTRGDDRGEFFLVLPSHALQASDLSDSFDVRISVAGPAVVPVPSTPDVAAQDSFWDLPLEEVPAVGLADNVSNGASLPSGYVTAPSAVRTISFQIGRVLNGRDEADFEFSLP